MNADGDLLILDANCEYIGYIRPPIENFIAHSIVPYTRGFILGGTQSSLIVYEKTLNETNPYLPLGPPIKISDHLNEAVDKNELKNDLTESDIRCISLSPQSEDYITVILENS